MAQCFRNRFQRYGTGTRSEGTLSMSPSITDVARLAGVGKGTVSRVLNEKPGVSESTATRVKQAIRQLGYTPNVQARRLARNVSDLVCFVLSNRDFLHEFHSMVLKGVESHCSEANRDLVFALWRYPLDPPPPVISLPRIIAGRGSVDGVVLAGANHIDCVRAVMKLGVPCVTVGNNLVGCRGMSEVDSVWYDESTGTREAIRYLADLGHRHIRFVGNTALPWFARNYRAYSDAMIDLGLAPVGLSASETTDYAEFAEEAARAIAESREPTTAVMAANDATAVALIRSLARRGISVPRDVSVIGFDDVPRCMEVDPPLTTVHVPTEALGRECARFLLEKIADPGSVCGARVIQTSLVVRGSCSAPTRD